ncbi:MAG: hypothetical protein M0Q13_13600 [Methanothrix sp.]|jgi:hypothetical protein|nr:hypothetical protein [Methanothrix sp.]
MIYDYSIQCPKCGSYHTEWYNDQRCLICGSCGNNIRLEDSFKDESIRKAHGYLMKDKEDIMPNDTVNVYDHIINEKRYGKVIKRYGIVTHMKNSYLNWPYDDLCDIEFSDRISNGHFTYSLEKVI